MADEAPEHLTDRVRDGPAGEGSDLPDGPEGVRALAPA
jgi:hypothetical protein